MTMMMTIMTTPLLPDPLLSNINESGDNIQHLRGELREAELKEQKKKLVYAFYDFVLKEYNISPSEINLNQFEISDDGKILYCVIDDIKINMISRKGGTNFISITVFIKEYNKQAGTSRAVRTYLNWALLVLVVGLLYTAAFKK